MRRRPLIPGPGATRAAIAAIKTVPNLNRSNRPPCYPNNRPPVRAAAISAIGQCGLPHRKTLGGASPLIPFAR
jgi:hypothetical protein